LLKAEVASSRLGYSLRGDRIEKGTGQRYEIENGKFTTCRCAKGPPSWSLTGKKLDVSLNGYGRLEEARFCILDVPVLYLPRLAVPVHSERQTGILFPEIGFSNQRGFRIQQPFYWAINKSQDLTLTPTVETSARIGLVNQYRYAFRRDMHGELEVAYYNEAIRGTATGTTTDEDVTADIPENRWALTSKSSVTISFSVRSRRRGSTTVVSSRIAPDRLRPHGPDS
jgi:lipopolysaccharide assembly outer membrane protein LptD (OstA)